MNDADFIELAKKYPPPQEWFDNDADLFGDEEKIEPPEFKWGKTIYRARKLAGEFSKETTQDY